MKHPIISAHNPQTPPATGPSHRPARIVQKIGYRSVQDFLKDFKVSQTEYSEYRTAIAKWKKETGKEPVAHGIRAKLAEKKQEIQNAQKNKQHTRSQNKDRGAR